jgi:hypothetical protein
VARAVTLGLVLLALGLRLPGLGTDFWLDEIWALQNVGAIGSPLGVFTVIHHDSNHWLVSLWMYVVGQDAAFWVYRLPSLVAGVATVIVAGRLAGAERSDRALAMLLVAVSFPLGFYASEARGYAVAACASLASFLCLLRWLETDNRRWLAAHWVVAGAGLLAHLSFVAVLAAEAVFLGAIVVTGRSRPFRLMLPLGGPLVVLIALIVVDLRFLQLGGGPPLDAWGLLADVGALALGGPVGSRWTPVVAAGALVVLALALAVQARKESPGAGTTADPGGLTWVFYAAVLLLPVIGALALRPPFFFPRYFLVSLVFVPIILSSALPRLARDRRYAALTLLVLLNAWSWSAFAGAGRGHYAEAVTDIARAAGGPTTVASDHDFRVLTVLDFYKRRAGLTPERLSYVKTGGRFFISSDPKAADPPADCAGCTLLSHYPSSALSGSPWRIYRRGERREVQVPDVGAQVAADDDVAVPGEVVEQGLPDFRVRLDAHERRPESLDVETRQRLRLPELDVHVEEVDAFDAFGGQQVIQGDRRDLTALERFTRAPGERGHT